MLHEQGAHSFDVHSEGIHHGKQEDLMRLGDDEESRLVAQSITLMVCPMPFGPAAGTASTLSPLGRPGQLAATVLVAPEC